MIKIKFNYYESDMTDFLYFNLTRKDYKKWFYYISALLIVTVGIVLAIVTSVIIGAIVIVIGSITFGVYPLLAKSYAKKYAKDYVKRSAEEYTISKDGIIVDNTFRKLVFRWSDFQQIIETSKYYYLYFGFSKAIIINKITINKKDEEELSKIISHIPVKHRKYN